VDDHPRDLLRLLEADERPGDVLPRMSAEPVPTTITFGSLSATSSPPIEPPKKPSEMFVHDMPASVDLKTPPPVPPK
jgi:hypothetical protein